MVHRIGSAVACAALATGGLLVAATPTQGAPLGSSNTFGAICPSPYGTVQIVGTPGNGQCRFTPGFVLGTHQLGVPYAVAINGEPAVQKAGPVPAGAVTCTLVAPDGTAFGTVTVVVRGKP
jgi:hypothetical protein